MSLRPLRLGTLAGLAVVAGLVLTGTAVAINPRTHGTVELAQATPPPPPAAPGAPGTPGAPGAPGAERGRGEPRMSPRAVCQDMVARRIGDRAYVKARLELKPEQMAAWNAFEKAADEASSKSMARCATLPTERKDRPDYLQRLTMEEDLLKARLATLDAVQPSLTALYNVLTAEQKAVFDRPHGLAMGPHRMERR